MLSFLNVLSVHLALPSVALIVTHVATVSVQHLSELFVDILFIFRLMLAVTVLLPFYNSCFEHCSGMIYVSFCVKIFIWSNHWWNYYTGWMTFGRNYKKQRLFLTEIFEIIIRVKVLHQIDDGKQTITNWWWMDFQSLGESLLSLTGYHS